MPAKRKPKKRTDDDYIALDDALDVLLDWRTEIVGDMAKHGESWRAFSAVTDAIRRIHDGE